MSRWTLQTGAPYRDRFSNFLQDIQEIQRILNVDQTSCQSPLELNIRIRSSHAVKPDVQPLLLRLMPAIVQLREREQLVTTADLLFPTNSLQTIAFSLPRKPKDQAPFQNAVRRAPTLECLQLYVKTPVTAQRAVNFLNILPELPKVVSLRLVTRGHPACLPAEYLQHITTLELGTEVSFSGHPPALSSLTIESLDSRYDNYAVMMSQLNNMVSIVNITVDDFVAPALCLLPTNLQQLSLSKKLDAGLWGSLQEKLSVITGLHRLTNLRSLFISDFFSASLVTLLAGSVFSHLLTLGISVSSFEANEYHVVDDIKSNLLVKPSLLQMQSVFPQLQHLKVSCIDTELKYKNMTLDFSPITHIAFPRLLGVTFCSPHVTLQIVNFPQGVQKMFKAHLHA